MAGIDHPAWHARPTTASLSVLPATLQRMVTNRCHADTTVYFLACGMAHGMVWRLNTRRTTIHGWRGVMYY